MVESSVSLRTRFKSRGIASFTLVEMLVSIVILVIIIGIVFTMTQQTSNMWKNTSGNIEAFRGARSGFDAMTRTLSQATLNPYYAYTYGVSNGTNSFTPASTAALSYGRNSDLQMVCLNTSKVAAQLPLFKPSGAPAANFAVTHAIFFQAPLGMTSDNTAYANMPGLLNACGFYVIYGPDYTKPSYITTSATRYRYKLMQFTQPTDSLEIYVPGSGQGTSVWYWTALRGDQHLTPPTMDFILAENVVAMVILPKLATQDETTIRANSTYATPSGNNPTAGTLLAPSYSYDSTTLGQGGSSINSTTGLAPYPLLNSFAQMPPVIQVTMVAIDEASAIKLSAELGASASTATAANAKLGLTTTSFTQASNYQTDLNAMETAMVADHLHFHVFQTDVAIRGAKWTGGN